MENLQGGTLALEHRYHIEQRLRSAGLTTIYGGIQDPFELPVQITVYEGLPEAGAQDSIIQRIKDSARQASTLPAKGLLRVHDFGELDRGVPFIIEETITGRSLAQVLERRGVFSPGDVADLVERLADLLAIAHAQKLFHGDLQPRWIILPENDETLANAHLCHFGLGLSMAELLAMPQAVLTTDLVDAFPPEAFQSGPDDKITPHLSAAADQWALAALAYRLLVGVHPFFDDPVDASEGILRIKTEEAPSLKEMGISDEIAQVVDRALRQDPKERWPSITAFANAFISAVRGSEDFTDDRGSLPPERTVDDHLPELEEPQEQAPAETAGGPRPSGYLLTFALMALLLSNLGWFFLMMSQEEAAAESANLDASTLPSGLQIQTSPPGAEIFIVTNGESLETSPIGSTPFVISSALREHHSLELLLRLPGFEDQRLIVEETPAGQDLRLTLQPQE